MDDKFIFISHRSINKDFADILESFFTKCGIPYNRIFCSSLPGNDIKQTISSEIKTALKTSKIDIVILSNEYYDSPYCQNEIGVIWYKDDTIKIPICLPELNEDDMQGFLDSEYKIRRFDSRKDIDTICDMIRPLFNTFITSTAKLNLYIDKLIEEYKSAIEQRKVIDSEKNRVKSIKENKLEEKILNNDFNDDELIIIKYIHDNQTNILHNDYQLLNEWLRKVNISKTLGCSPETLMIEEKLMEYVSDESWNIYGTKFRFC